MKHLTEEKMYAQVGLPLSSLIPFRTALFSTFQGESIRNIRQEWEETNVTKQKLWELSQVSSRGHYTTDESPFESQPTRLFLYCPIQVVISLYRTIYETQVLIIIFLIDKMDPP